MDSWADMGLEVLHSTDFDGERLNRPGTYIVCFGATWCGPTRHFMPKFVALKEKLPGTLAIADITSYEEPLWDTFRIEVTPSIIVFQDGAIRMRLDGKLVFGITGGMLAKLDQELGVA